MIPPLSRISMSFRSFLRLLVSVPRLAGTVVLSLLLLTACATESRSPEPTSFASVSPNAPSLLLLSDADDAEGTRCTQEVRRTLAYAKWSYEHIDLAAGTPLPDLTPYRAVVVATARLDRLSSADARRLKQYVSDGGGLAVLSGGWHPLLGGLFGYPATFAPDVRSLPDEQVVLHGHLMPGTDNLTIDSVWVSILDVEVDGASRPPSATILATAGRSGRPLAWLVPYGSGRTVFWNAGLLTQKAFRGLILQSISAVQPYTVRPMANWGALYLDDFPSPALSTPVEPIASELGLSPAAFYATHWYPDMRRLADEFGLTYTSTVIYSYDGAVTPPYRFAEWLMGRVAVPGDAVYYSPWIAQQDARHSEMALHGYNHQPLTLDRWTAGHFMRESLSAARHRWELESPAPLPTTYVPPMNEIDSTGVQALVNTFPSLTTIAGLHDGTYAFGQDREFGPEPWNKSLYALPRNTSGYILSDRLRLQMTSLMEVLGGWGHFVHPDEVFPNEDRYDSMRSMGIAIPETGFRWYGESARPGLYYRFRKLLTFAHTHYPWLRYGTAQDAATIMQAYEHLTWRWDAPTPGTLQVQTTQVPSFFVVYVSSETDIASLSGGALLQRTETPLLTKFVIQASAPVVTIEMTTPPTGPVASHAALF